MSTDRGTGREPTGPGSRRVQAAALRAPDAGRLLVLRAAALFDGVSPALIAEPSVVVADGAITAVHGPAAPLPAGACVVDLPGLTLMPGLVDAHLHLCFDASDDPAGHLAGTGGDLLREQMAGAARRALRAGVTTVRDLGDRGYLALDLRDQRRAGGGEPLPAIVAAGPPITIPGGHCHFLGGAASGNRALRAAVIKVMAKPHDVLRFAPEDLAAAGLSTAEILQAMTSRAARACGLGHRKGRIAPGFDADILAIDGNPLADLAAIRRLRAVYARGRAVLPVVGSPVEVEVP